MTPPVTVVVRRKGPYRIEGPVLIVDQDGNVIEPPPSKIPGVIKLCGCGLSNSKPFCDGSHKSETAITGDGPAG